MAKLCVPTRVANGPKGNLAKYIHTCVPPADPDTAQFFMIHRQCALKIKGVRRTASAFKQKRGGT